MMQNQDAFFGFQNVILPQKHAKFNDCGKIAI